MVPAISVRAIPNTQRLLSTKKVTLTLYNKKDVLYGFKKTKMNSQTLGYVDGERVTNLKSSNRSVLTVSKTESPFGNRIWTNIAANVKKTGTSTVSFETGGKTYKIKVTVKKYQNPISSIKIRNTTIRGSKFKSTSNYFLKWSKFKGKNTKVTVKLAKGWKFCHKEFDYESGKLRPVILAYPGSFPKRVVPTVINGQSIKIKGKKGYTLNFTVEQRSTGRTEDISIIFK